MRARATQMRAVPGCRRLMLLLLQTAVLVASWMLGIEKSQGQEWLRTDPNRIEVVVLRNLAHYVAWPMDAFADAKAPWRIGVLGADPFGNLLEEALQGRTEQGRPFEVVRADTLSELPPCQIVFVALKDVRTRRAALSSLKNQPVLTVGDVPGFLEEGGIIRFQVTDRVEMSVNLDQARSVSLQIQTKMLEVAREVLENGAVRRLR